MKKIITLIFFTFFIASCDRNVEPTWAEHFSELPQYCDVVISGDFMQHLPQINAARVDSGFDYDSSLRYISPLWRSADFAVINLETTLTFSTNYSGYPMFRAPVECVFALARAGISHAMLANNHCVDGGAKGVRETLAALDSVGIYHAGLYVDSLSSTHIEMLSKGRFRIALLNYTYSVNGNAMPRGMVVSELDTALMARQLAEARKTATHIIVVVHWGDEYSVEANREQRELALWCRDRGADVVVGSHPHVPQQIDFERKIVYSLGNFVSNQRMPHTFAGVSVKLTFCDSIREPRIKFLPHFVDISSTKPGERYRVLPAYSGDVIDDVATRKEFDRTMDNVREIVYADIEYD